MLLPLFLTKQMHANSLFEVVRVRIMIDCYAVVINAVSVIECAYKNGKSLLEGLLDVIYTDVCITSTTIA